MSVSVVNKSNTYMSNVVDSNTLRSYQKFVLRDLSDILKCSFGPHGSNTLIKVINGLNTYTKDGHTILCNVKFSGIVEEAIRSDIESITYHIANTVGDGTTSAVILSSHIFENLMEDMEVNSYLPAEVVRALEKFTKMMGDKIKKTAKTATLQDIYDIAYISSNGDENIANMIKAIYEECGMEVFIDVAMTTAQETSIKYYDGMTLDTGYSDSCFVTNSEENTCEVSNPDIYFFEDPIDTREMGVFLDTILNANIMNAIRNKDYDSMVPTVIVCPKISRDMSSLLDTLLQLQSRQPVGNKLPVVVITGTHQIAELSDICKMCGARTIRKYIDRTLYEADVKNGLAPTPETVKEWAGSAAQVIAYSNKTKFISPIAMKDANGEYTNEYKNMLHYLETELSKCQSDGEDAHTTGTLKRRIHSLKSNLVEIYAGGMTVADRDSMRHLLEDAVKNCRSAAMNGVGFAANFSGLLAIRDYFVNDVHNLDIDDIMRSVATALYDAYFDLIYALYRNNMEGSDGEVIHMVDQSIAKRQPINLRTMTYDDNVKSSIESDIIIMETVTKIVAIMVTCNQFMTPNPQMNVYSDLKEVEIDV